MTTRPHRRDALRRGLGVSGPREGLRAALLVALGSAALATGGDEPATALQWAPPEAVLRDFDALAPPSGLGVGDLDGDGLEDLLVPRGVFRSFDAFPILLLVNDGEGGFEHATERLLPEGVPSSFGVREIVFADFNGDGHEDAFLADFGPDAAPFPGGQNRLLLSTETGLRDASAELPQRRHVTHSATTGDVDADGDVDLFVGNLGVSHGFLLNDGEGGFSPAEDALPELIRSGAGGFYTTSHLFDADGDGDLDLFLGGWGAGSPLRLLRNDGEGHFAAAEGALPEKSFGDATVVVDSLSVDVDADGDPDLLVSSTQEDPFYVGREVQLLLNDGNGVFRDGTAERMPPDPLRTTAPWDWWIFARDLNADCRTDLLVRSNGGADSSRLLVQQPDGTYAPVPSSALPLYPWPGSGSSLWLWRPYDADGDGGIDVVATSNGDLADLRFLNVWVGRFEGSTVACPEPGGAASAVALLALWGMAGARSGASDVLRTGPRGAQDPRRGRGAHPRRPSGPHHRAPAARLRERVGLGRR